MHTNILRPRPPRRLLAALGLVALAATTLPARAAAPASTPPLVFAFSDSRTLPGAVTLLAHLPGARALICPAGAPAPLVPLTLTQALDDVTAALVRAHGRTALAALAQGSVGHSAGTAEHAMAGAIIAGRPDAALAAALLAHQHAPDDPRPLVDMAALLPDRGLAREALALLDAADQLRYPSDAPLGISLRAVSANNRGYALLDLHRWQQAEAPLARVARLAPRLSEANLNLGAATLCAGDTRHAARYFLAGGRRDSFQFDQIDGIGDPPISEQARPDEIFDLSAGVARRLPALTYPLTPGQAVAMHPVYHEIDFHTVLAVIAARNASESAIRARLPQNLNHLTWQRTWDILGAIGGANLAPDLHTLWTRMNSDNAAVYAVDRAFWGAKVMLWAETLPSSQFKARCTSSLPAAHRQWLAAMNTLDSATRAWWQAYSRYASGLAANLANSAYHALAESWIARSGELAYYSYLFGPVWDWTNYEWGWRTSCLPGPDTAGASPNWPAPQVEDPPAPTCPVGIAAPHNLVLTLPPPFDHINLKANCESVSVQFESPEPGIKGFIAGSRDWRTGETTVVIGPKVGVSIPGTGISGGIETGIYVTTGKSGVTDWGVSINLTGTGVSTPSGLASFEANAPVTISLAGSIDYIPTALGLGQQ